jgi:hypothetical protein
MLTNALLGIQTATSGLLYTSETDSPFELVHWKKRDTILSSADLLGFIGQSSGLPVENVGLGEFFHDLIEDRDWHNAEAKNTVRKYRHLLTVLKEHLSDLKVFKVGEVEIDIYIVGQTPEGDWAGVMTTAVET